MLQAMWNMASPFQVSGVGQQIWMMPAPIYNL